MDIVKTLRLAKARDVSTRHIIFHRYRALTGDRIWTIEQSFYYHWIHA